MWLEILFVLVLFFYFEKRKGGGIWFFPSFLYGFFSVRTMNNPTIAIAMIIAMTPDAKYIIRSLVVAVFVCADWVGAAVATSPA